MKDNSNNLTKLREIKSETAKEFCKGERDLIILDKYQYFGLFRGDVLVSSIGVHITDKKAKIHAFYTPPDLRGNGYFTLLLQGVIDMMKNTSVKTVFADALEPSKNILSSLGFELIREKQFKRFKIYYFRRELKNGY